VNGTVLRRAATDVGVLVALVIAVWLGMFNVAVSALVVSNTVRGIEPVSLLFAVCVLCLRLVRWDCLAHPICHARTGCPCAAQVDRITTPRRWRTFMGIAIVAMAAV
jgi:hypothetical protein